MSTAKSEVLLEIGCEELPASFVDAALEALPGLVGDKLRELRLAFEKVDAFGTPRRIVVLVHGMDAAQRDLEEELMGPPVKAAFKDGAPTRAAEAFAEKVGCPVAELQRVETPKGEYLKGTKRAKGRPAKELLADALVAIIRAIPFRKSMRWADLDVTFGRPIQWIVALVDGDVVPFEFASVKSGRTSLGHRFLAPAGLISKTPVEVHLGSPGVYLDELRKAHVLVDPAERRAALARALETAASSAGGSLIEDEFLMKENLTLVEEPFVIVGGFDRQYLELPEDVILAVARGHQRYFCLRDKEKKLMPNYLAVVNTALGPDTIRRGNDSVMRARLADARFFYKTDLAVPLASRREKLGGVVFQKRLGSMLEKAVRVERLATEIGVGLGLAEPTIMAAVTGAHLAKCDLVSLMVGEFPELQGEMGRAYALAQGVEPHAAEVISEHYKPKGAQDGVPATDAGALVGIADRLDSLVGCFAVGLVPTGAADPFALRRATLGILRTAIERKFDVSIPDLVRLAHAGYAGAKLDLGADDVVGKIQEFTTERLRGLLSDKLPADAVRASVAAGAERPLDVLARANALASLDAATRAQVGEVFKRATNIAKEAKPGEPAPPAGDAHASEVALFEAFVRFQKTTAELASSRDYAGFLREVASIAPVMQRYFTDVFVMSDDLAVRDNRLRLMRSISERCASIARLELLAA